MTSKRSKEPADRSETERHCRPRRVRGAPHPARARASSNTPASSSRRTRPAVRYDDDAMEQHHVSVRGRRRHADRRRRERERGPLFQPRLRAQLRGGDRGRTHLHRGHRRRRPGHELVYDYALVRDDSWQDRWAELYACRCGAPRCRGTILKSPKPPRKTAKKGGDPRRRRRERAIREGSGERAIREGARRARAPRRRP